MKRRDFLLTAWRGLGAVAAAGAGFIGVRYLGSQQRTSATGGIVTAGWVDDFALESVTPFLEKRFYLVRNRDGGFLALSRQCSHLSCMVLWEEDHFRCPCHGSAFTREGEVLNPPAPRPLSCFVISIEGGQVRVDTGKISERLSPIYPSEQTA